MDALGKRNNTMNTAPIAPATPWANAPARRMLADIDAVIEYLRWHIDELAETLDSIEAQADTIGRTYGIEREHVTYDDGRRATPDDIDAIADDVRTAVREIEKSMVSLRPTIRRIETDAADLAADLSTTTENTNTTP